MNAKIRYFYCAATDRYVVWERDKRVVTVRDYNGNIKYTQGYSESQIDIQLNSNHWRELEKYEVALIF